MNTVLGPLLILASLSFAGSAGLVAIEILLGRPGKLGSFIPFLLTIALGALVVSRWGAQSACIAFVWLNLLLLLTRKRWAHGISTAGTLTLVSNAETVVLGLAWAVWFIIDIDVHLATRLLMIASFPLLAITTLTSVIQGVEQWEPLIRATWRRPRHALVPMANGYEPLVSIHVPVYAEPPGVVIQTLNSISRLAYTNYEVIVIDNNTKDESLWQPVEAHCRSLGARYRFFHVDSIPGAKAGALNFALGHTSPSAELVAIVDSDYQVHASFLASLVGYFDDPQMGFVQTPHDYREWQNNSFLRKCYWEYRYFFETNLVSQNERDAAIIVGTMCLIRRTALERAGGWAEWCATEDSELAIRIHAQGYTSVYINQTFGRGLIPETYGGFKKQRHRWTVGPVQEFKRHWRLFLPAPLGKPSLLTPLQKLHHLNHGIENISMGLSFFTIVLGAAIVASMTVHGEVVPVPFALWLVATVTLLTSVLHWSLVYCLLCRAGVRGMVGAYVASKALTYIRGVGSLRGLVSSGIVWHRTNKFKAQTSGFGAVRQAKGETLLALASLFFGVLALVLVPHPGLLRMLAIGALIQCVFYAAAPALALLAERELTTPSVAAETPRQEWELSGSVAAD